MNWDAEVVAETAAEEKTRLHNMAVSIPSDEDKKNSSNYRS